jgi:hypothetical protein
MSKQALKFVSDGMEAIGLEYDFETFKKKPIVYPYFVGQYTEQEPRTEDGLQESTLMLTGFHRGEWLALEDGKEKIEKYFDPIDGKVVITDHGSAVAIFYAGSVPVSTGDDELQPIQINLHVKEWKVNN